MDTEEYLSVRGVLRSSMIGLQRADYTCSAALAIWRIGDDISVVNKIRCHMVVFLT